MKLRDSSVEYSYEGAMGAKDVDWRRGLSLNISSLLFPSNAMVWYDVTLGGQDPLAPNGPGRGRRIPVKYSTTTNKFITSFLSGGFVMWLG